MRRVCGLWLILIWPALARAQSVEVSLDPPAITMEDTATLTVVLSGSFDDVRGPDMPDLQIVGRSSGTSVTVVNGRMSQQQRIVLQLAPKRTGQLVIGSVQVLQRGKVVAESRPLTLRVLPRGTPPQVPPPPSPGPPVGIPPGDRPPDDDPRPEPPPRGGEVLPESEAGRPAFLWVRTPERPLYLGEPIPVEYRLYVRSDWPLTALSVNAQPAFRGFVVEPGEADPQQVDRVQIRGRSFDVRVLWRGAVTPLQAGTAVLDPMRLTLTVGDLFSRQRLGVASEAVRLEVLPVPEEGRPADWVEGLVGTFAIRARVDRQVLGLGESALLTVEVTGSGNLGALQVPEVPIPESVRVTRVPSQDLDERVVDRAGVSGRRTFQFLLSPREAGEVEIGRIDLAFFNPLTRRFDRARTEPIRLRVSPGGGSGETVVQGPGDREPRLLVIEQFSGGAGPEPSPRPNSAPWALLGLPVLVWVGVEGWAMHQRARKRNPLSGIRREAVQKARRRLTALRGQDLPPVAYWTALEAVLRDFLGERLGLAPGLSPSEVARALTDLGIDASLALTVQQELEACAFGRFAPSAVQDQDHPGALMRVERVIRDLANARERRDGERP